uniref:DDE Tnp4 domain-containing protein n=1 Tax=Astatotilapia calliptera TaxID=8154 RepID=A0A3P8P448_ASTCA
MVEGGLLKVLYQHFLSGMAIKLNHRGVVFGRERSDSKVLQEIMTTAQSLSHLHWTYLHQLQKTCPKTIILLVHSLRSNIFPFVFTFQRQLLQPIDEFFLFLVFLSVGLKERDLAHRFNIHQSTVSRIIATWTNFLATALGSQCIWLTREEVQAYLPEEFKDFSDTQMILDCTELRCQTPSSPLLQSEMYSSYKSHCTMKALVGIAPHGPVTFISNLYAGSVSDKELFKQSGIAEKLTEDMAVMVDKGFLITDCCKCKVYCPPFLSKQKQMPAYQVKETQAIARLRVHVERVIRRIKQNKLFDSIITMSHVYNINQLFAVALRQDGFFPRHQCQYK